MSNTNQTKLTPEYLAKLEGAKKAQEAYNRMIVEDNRKKAPVRSTYSYAQLIAEAEGKGQEELRKAGYPAIAAAATATAGVLLVIGVNAMSGLIHPENVAKPAPAISSGIHELK